MNTTINLVVHPHPALVEVARPIEEITPEIIELSKAMVRVCLQHKGIGLAANQVGVPVRMFVAKNGKGVVQTYINPEITSRSPHEEDAREGCLSHPGALVTVRRSLSVRIRFRDLEWNDCLRGAMGLDARCWQHEIDHLNGINIIDFIKEQA